MITNLEMMAKEVHDVQLARWAGFKRLAKRLPNHHILSVELIRTHHDETAAVFTVVRNHVPVQYVVMGDANGRVKPNQGRPHKAPSEAASAQLETVTVEGPTDPADPDIIALGEPPPKEPPPPGIVAVGAGLLAAAFDVGERVPPG